MFVRRKPYIRTMMFDLGLDNAIKHACLCHLIFIK